LIASPPFNDRYLHFKAVVTPFVTSRLSAPVVAA
jgi:hypothetical protein